MDVACSSKADMNNAYDAMFGLPHRKKFDFRHIWEDNFFVVVALRPNGVMASSFLRFLDHTQRHTTVGRTPLDE